MAFNKKFFTTGGIVASSAAPTPAAVDALANFETVTYTGNGGTQKITGYIRKGAAFNGSSSIINVSGILSGITNTFSYSCWFKISDSSKSFCVFDDGVGATSNLIQFIPSHSNGNYYIAFGTDANRLAGARPSSFVDGNWHHMVVTKSSNALRFYVDNSLISENTSHTDSVSGLSNAQIGKYLSNFSSGSIDQVRIFNKALSSSEVTTLYGETYASSTKSTTDIFGYGSGVALYELDEDAKDTGDTYNGTPNNVNFLGMAFQPDLVWVKSRASGSHILTDSVRGNGKEIYSDLPNQEGTVNRFSLTTNGFDVTTTAYGNANGVGYVAWCWKAGGAASTYNIDGTGYATLSSAGLDGGTLAESKVLGISTNTEAGFSIIQYDASTGASPGQTIETGLTSDIELMIIKRTDSTSNWLVVDSITNKYHLLNSPAQGTNITYTDYVDGTKPKIYDFQTYVHYCFHSVDGYQKVGSYTGNGSSGGQTITGLGFNPRFLLVKNSTASAAWRLTDSARGDNTYLYPNLPNAEDSDSGYISLITDGFRLNGLDSNTSHTFIYLAIA